MIDEKEIDRLTKVIKKLKIDEAEAERLLENIQNELGSAECDLEDAKVGRKF